MKLFAPPRPMCANEIALLSDIFGDSVNWHNVRVYPRRFLPFQAAHTAMSPNGNMYFPNDTLHCSDFTQHNRQRTALFIHEAVHVWQRCLGFPVLLSGAILAAQGGYWRNRAYHYLDLIGQRNDLKQFNMEQQASIIEHYFAEKRFDGSENPVLKSILQRFLDNPNNPDLLPENLFL